MRLIIDVPEQFADALFADDVVGIPANDRSAADTIQGAIEVLGVAASLTSIVADGAAIPEVARRLVAWVTRQGTPPSQSSGSRKIRVHVVGSADTTITVVDADGHLSLEIAVAEVDTALRTLAEGRETS